MNLKHNANYFKKSDSTKFIGIGLVILGFVLFYFGWGWISYILMTASVPVGVVLFIVGSSGRADESAIDTCIESLTEGLEVDLSADNKYKSRLEKHISPEIVEGYEYSDGVMLKYSKNGSLCSSEYTKAIIYTLSDALYISARTVSVVSEEVRNVAIEIPFVSISRFEIKSEEKSLTFMKKSFHVRAFLLVIEYGDGLSLSLPIASSINSDRFVERVAKQIAERKSSEAN